MAWDGSGRGGRPWRRKRDAALRRDTYLCQICLARGIWTEAREVDHIIPIAQGGTDDSDNLQSLCVDCHKDKTAREAAQAKGQTARIKPKYDAKGFPVWD